MVKYCLSNEEFTEQESKKFEIRFEEGYDICDRDDRYKLWLSINHRKLQVYPLNFD